jgi:integrase
MCSRCLQRDPSRPFIAADHLSDRLADPPEWLSGFVVHLAGAYSPARATTMLTELGRLLADEHSNYPQSVLDRARRPGRSMGALARTLQDFFTEHRLALPTDHAERLAAGRRQRRIEAVPACLQQAVRDYESHLLNCRSRARRAGTLPRCDHTIESALSTIRDLAVFLNTFRNKHDWATVDISDVEAFLATSPTNQARNLTVLRQFFRFARRGHTVLIDPTTSLKRQKNKGFRGRTLTRPQQRELFKRWTIDPDVHPHEAFVGLLALLHGASSQEVRLLRCDDIDDALRTIRLGSRPHPVPIDPASWAALQRCMTHRAQWPTANPHVVVTKGTKAGRTASSTAYLSHVLDPCGYSPRMIRNTRLIDLVNTMDAKLVAAAFGMTPEATMIYLADRIDRGRIPEPPPPTL